MTLWVCLGSAVAGALIGLWLRASLAHLRYRRGPDSVMPASDLPGPTKAPLDESALPSPGSRWWIVIGLGLAWLLLALAFANRGWPWFTLWLPFTVFGAWLAAVDLDVRRLPDPVQGLLAVCTIVAGIGLSLTGYGNWRIGLIGGLSCGLVFFILNRINRYGLGLGDVKLVIICGWCLGLLGLAAIAYGLMAACLFALAWAITRRQRSFAFGPWLILGTVCAAIAAGFSWAGVVPLS